jgi:hypothetical protein
MSEYFLLEILMLAESSDFHPAGNGTGSTNT